MGTTAAPRSSFLEAITTVLRTVRSHWKTCLVISAGYGVLSGIADAVSRSSTSIVDPTTLRPADVTAAGIEAVMAMIVFVLVNIVVAPVSIGALSLVGSAAVYDDEVSAAGIARRALDRSLDVLAAFVLMALLLGAPVLVLSLLAGLVLVVGSPVGAFAVLSFGSFILALPLLYIYVRLSLAIPAVMREGRGPIDALRRSWSLVGGAWWLVFGVGVLFATALAALNVYWSLRSFAGPDTAFDFLLGAVLTGLLASVAVTLFGVALGVVYAMRAPEDTLPPDVEASEARAGVRRSGSDDASSDGVGATPSDT